MIKVSELRVGNVINGQGHLLPVSNILDDRVLQDGLVWYLKEKYIEPIQLTKDILKKCGFKQLEGWAVLNFNPRMQIRFYNWNSAECDIVQDEKFIAFKNSHIKYLHQLQNLYFSLSGEELQIKL